MYGTVPRLSIDHRKAVKVSTSTWDFLLFSFFPPIDHFPSLSKLSGRDNVLSVFRFHFGSFISRGQSSPLALIRDTHWRRIRTHAFCPKRAVKSGLMDWRMKTCLSILLFNWSVSRTHTYTHTHPAVVLLTCSLYTGLCGPLCVRVCLHINSISNEKSMIFLPEEESHTRVHAGWGISLSRLDANWISNE